MGLPLGPVQVIPPGFTGLLQIKQTGRLPDNILGDYTPVIEMRDWFMQARQLDELALFGAVPATASLLTATGSGPAPFSVGGSNAVVPGGQLWWVDLMTTASQIGVAAADTLVGALSMANNQGGNLTILGPNTTDVVTARARQFWCRSDRGFWMHPGDKFLFQVADILSVGGITMSLHLRATVLPI